MDCVACGLFDGLHFFFAASVVERADYNWLSDKDVSCGCQMSLRKSILVNVSLHESPGNGFRGLTFTVR